MKKRSIKTKKSAFFKNKKYLLLFFSVLVLIVFLSSLLVDENNMKKENTNFKCTKFDSSLECNWSGCSDSEAVLVLNHDGPDKRIQVINEENGSIVFTDLDGNYAPLLLCGDDISTLPPFFF